MSKEAMKRTEGKIIVPEVFKSKEEIEANRIVDIYVDTLDWGTPLVIANRCALIHVQGMIETLNKIRVTTYVRNEVDFLERVKEIIEKK